MELPRHLLIGAAALLGVTMALAAIGRLTQERAVPPPAVLERELRFFDREDGGVDVRDAKDGRLVDVVAPGTNGFLRGALRGLARERKRHGHGPEAAFRLTLRADGRLVLEDPATARRIDLDSFGPANREPFARLLSS